MTFFERTGSSLFLSDGIPKNLQENLQPGVYTLEMDPKIGFYLQYNCDKFEFNFKIYDIDTEFINYVLDSIAKNGGRNLGVLLNGVKGSGKTVDSKILANAIGYPVIIINHAYSGLTQFFSAFDFPCTIIFDEFEKNFREEAQQTDILTLMDGIYNSNRQKVFILTTNNLYVEENLLARPSRIRYIKKYTGLSDACMYNYINDNLIAVDRKDDIINIISMVKDCTIDIVKALVEEFNNHPTVPVDFITSYFNFEYVGRLYKNVIYMQLGESYAEYDDKIKNFITNAQEYIRMYCKRDNLMSMCGYDLCDIRFVDQRNVVTDNGDDKILSKEEIERSEQIKEFDRILKTDPYREMRYVESIKIPKSCYLLTRGDDFYQRMVVEKVYPEFNSIIVKDPDWESFRLFYIPDFHTYIKG